MIFLKIYGIAARWLDKRVLVGYNILARIEIMER